MAFALVLTSCEKENNKLNNNNSGSNYYLSAKVEGASVVIDTTNASLLFASITDNNSELQIEGSKLQGTSAEESFKITIAAGTYHGEDTYYLNADNNKASYKKAENLWETENGNPDTYGVLSIISTANGILQGTFRFYGRNADDGSLKEISEGKFRLRTEN